MSSPSSSEAQSTLASRLHDVGRANQAASLCLLASFAVRLVVRDRWRPVAVFVVEVVHDDGVESEHEVVEGVCDGVEGVVLAWWSCVS